MARLTHSMLSLLRPHNLNIRCSFSLVATLQCQIAKGQYVDATNGILNFGSVTDNGKETESVDVKPRSVPVHDAYQLLQAGHRYLDVRTSDEFSAGHPSGAINIPYMFRNEAGMSKNTNFLGEVSSHFGKDDEIIVGCQSGRRSLMASADLQSAGFARVTDVAGGYSAWTENGFPTAK